MFFEQLYFRVTFLAWAETRIVFYGMMVMKYREALAADPVF